MLQNVNENLKPYKTNNRRATSKLTSASKLPSTTCHMIQTGAAARASTAYGTPPPPKKTEHVPTSHSMFQLVPINSNLGNLT